MYTRQRIEKALTGMKTKRVLFICASPRDKNPLDFGKEYRTIIDALQASIDRMNFERDIIPSMKKSEFLTLLTQQMPDYLHLSMHSSLTQGLYFEDDAGSLAPMPVDEFAANIRTYNEQHPLLAVVLSACNSKGHAEAIRGSCQQAMGTRDVFPADAGICYASGFYELLFTSKDIKDCHEAGLMAIRQYKPPFDPVNNMAVDEIPQLF
jgi:hypothetical protein